MRQWYIQAAASPKDIVILLDTSGSMTGLRKNIALNVVFSILDTLTEDDFVQVLKVLMAIILSINLLIIIFFSSPMKLNTSARVLII